MEAAVTAGGLPGQIGRYRILGLLGEGASSRVYHAAESDPAREVALKVLKVASTESAQQERFKREADLLAQLEHPHIARLYAAGVAQTDLGPTPWLAMEWVRGADLCEQARRQQLSLEQRLILLAKIARAVHMAHSRGVIHRDLKPDNLRLDNAGEPRILDFGVAHVVDPLQSRLTVAGSVIGTLAYLAPEQLGGSRVPDPQTDVYALGVIGYELLAGRLPDPALSTSTALEALVRLRTQTPPALSRVYPAARGDVETVIGKAMAQEPRQRYGSALELATDLERLLQHLPITARPPRLGYLLGLFVRRHPGLSAGLATALITLIGATGVSLHYALSEARARAEAETRSAELTAVNRFLEDMLTSADPTRAQGRQLTVLQALDAARDQLQRGPALPPAVSLQLQRTLGNTYGALGASQESLTLLDAAREQAVQLEGAESLAVRLIDVPRALALSQLNRHEPAAALLGTLIAALPRGGDAAGRAHHLAQKALVAQELTLGQPQAAASRLPGLIAAAAEDLGALDPVTLNLRQLQLDSIFFTTDDPKAALAVARDLADTFEQHYGPDHPQTLVTRFAEASWLSQSGETEAAVVRSRDILARRARVLGEDHVLTHETRTQLSSFLRDLDQNAEALTLAQTAWSRLRILEGEDDAQTGFAADVLVLLYEEAGQVEQAEAMYRGRLARIAGRPEGAGVNDLPVFYNYAFLLMNAERWPQAIAAFEAVIAEGDRLLPPESYDRARFASAFGECLLRAGQPARALQLLEPAHAQLLASLGAEHRLTQRALERLQRARAALAPIQAPGKTT